MRNFLHYTLRVVALVVVANFVLLPVRVATASALCDEFGCEAAIAETKYHGYEAWRLTDGKTEATVVPALGRVMSFKLVGGDEWLWSAIEGSGKPVKWGAWTNWGGDKTWLAPQSRWGDFGSSNGWPPPREWDQMPFGAQVLSGGKLKIWSPVSSAGWRISRIFYHDDNGEFVVEQTVHKLHGDTQAASIWSVTQIGGDKIDAVFLPRTASSSYEDGFVWLSKERDRVAPQAVLPRVLAVKPTLIGSYKIGTDAPRAALAAMRGDWAFVQRAPRPDGIYPDGQDGKSGTPAQLFGLGDAKMNYLEVELLSPLLEFPAASQETHTVRWSIEQLPSANADDPAVHAAIDKLLG